MEENVGLADRMIRFVLAIVFIILGFAFSPWWFVLAAIALITGLLGYCGLYSIFKCDTITPAVKTVRKPSRAKKKVAKKTVKRKRKR